MLAPDGVAYSVFCFFAVTPIFFYSNNNYKTEQVKVNFCYIIIIIIIIIKSLFPEGSPLSQMAHPPWGPQQ